MNEDKKLILEETFDTAQNILGSITRTGSSLIQSGVQVADDFIDQNIPGGEQFTDNWKKGAAGFVGASARFIQQELEAADRQVDRPIDNIGNIPYFVVGAFNRGKQQYTENAQRLAESAGIDPRAGNVLGEVAGEIALVGAGKLASAATKGIPPGTGGMTPQLATATASPMGLAPSASNGSISLKRPQVLEAKRDKFYNQGEWNVTQGKRIDEARDAVDAAREIMENIKDANPGVKHGELRKTIPEYKAADKALRAKMPRISSEESNLLAPSKGREQAYPPAKPRAKELKGIFTRQARREKVRKGVDQIIEQVDLHHKFPKGISAAFFNRGRDLIEDGVMTYNDLVNMAKRAQKKGIEPGDIETNLEPMFKTPHDTFHAEMRAQPSYQFPGDNLEISKTKLTQRLRKVKNKKDLNELWNQLLSEDAKYLYETAEIWQPMDKVIKSVSPEYTGTAKSKK